MWPRAGVLAALLALLMLAGPAPQAEAIELRVPEGYAVSHREPLADGVVQFTLTRRDPSQSVQVAWVAEDAPVALRSVLANNRLSGPRPRLERTSAMCARINCIAAVNADFAFPDTNEPVGAVVSHRELMRSPNREHHQLHIGADGELSTGTGLDWQGTLMATDLRDLTVNGVNIPRRPDQLVLYTPTHGPWTGTNPHGIEIPFEVLRPEGRIRLGQTALVRFHGRHEGGGSRIPDNGGVLSGHGEQAHELNRLWQRVESGYAANEALLRLESPQEVSESVGGSPILVREGRVWFSDAPTSFVRGRHPRTLAGWTAAGDKLLVTVDGRQPGHSTGMTLREAAHLMIGLGAVEAINLDGGGSTTFVAHGQVRNLPSDRKVDRDGRTRIVATTRDGDRVHGNVERPVVNALAIVPRGGGPAEPVSPLDPDDVALPQALSSVPPADPASSPEDAMPGLISVPPPPDETLEAQPRRDTNASVLVLAVAFAAVAAAATLASDPRFTRGGTPRRPASGRL